MLRLKHLLRYLRALPIIRVHTELDGRTLGIVHSLIQAIEATVWKGTIKCEEGVGWASF